MSSTAREVVITGLGATTPLGGDVPTTWAHAQAGDSGVATLEHEWVSKYDLPVTFAGELAVPAAEILAVPELKRMDPNAQYALIAAREAWTDSGAPTVDGERLASVIATGIGGVSTLVSSWDILRDRGPRRVPPLTVPMLMPNSAAAYVSIEFGARAGARAPVSACASGAEAIALGAQLIRTGEADVVIAGGTEAAIHPLPIASFAKMQAMSTRNDDPQGASRPYDRDRDGFVLGEGAGVVILESAEHAAARGAHVYAKLSGTGITADAYGIAPPDPEGTYQQRAMELAMHEAGVTGADVVHVNAHATATPTGDTIEAAAIARALGPSTSAVISATKSMTGHLLGGAGAVETILTVLALRDRVAPPTINLANPEPGLPVDIAANVARPLGSAGTAAINNAFGFGGHNVALVITSP